MQERFVKSLCLFVFLFGCFFYKIAWAADDTTVGQYLTVEDKPKLSQVDLLSQTIQVRFPQDVKTVGDALNYILRLSGYSLVPEGQQSDALKTTLTKPLPMIDHDFGPMSLRDGLYTLVGPAFYLVHNPVNRTVNFSLKPQFEKFYAATKSGTKS